MYAVKLELNYYLYDYIIISYGTIFPRLSSVSGYMVTPAERLSGRLGAERGLSIPVGVIQDIVREIGSEEARKGAQRFLDFLDRLDQGINGSSGGDLLDERFSLHEILAFLVFYDELDEHDRQVPRVEARVSNPMVEGMYTYSQVATTQLGFISLVLPFLVTELRGKHPQSLSVLSK